MDNEADLSGLLSSPAPSPLRLVSLDVLRGLAVMGMIFVNASGYLSDKYEVDVAPTLLHSHWAGLKFADLVFPAFVLMVGVSIPLALHRFRVNAEQRRIQARHVAWRTLRIVLLGVLLTNLDWFSDGAEPWRPWGVLQRIGLVYGACAWLFLHCRTRTLVQWTCILLVGYWLLSFVPALDGLPNDLALRGHNFPASIDRLLFGRGDHLWVPGPAGYDPEGLLGTLPAIAQGLIGVLVGEYLRRRDYETHRLLAAGVFMLVAGLLWGLAFPIVKDLWSSSFVFVTSGITTLVLASLRVVCDGGNGGAQGTPSTGKRVLAMVMSIPLSFGLNAISAYVVHEIAAPMLMWRVFLAPFEWAAPIVGEPLAALWPPLLFLALIWLGMDYLRRRRWVVKI